MFPLLIVLIVAGTSIWVLVDSTNLGAERDKAIGMAGTSPAAWFFGCLLFWIIVFPLYLYQRPKIAAAFSDEAYDPTKTCPRCAEDVKSAATVCRFCGHEFVLQ